MSMTAQEWQEVELRHDWREIAFEREVREVEPKPHHAKPRKQVDPMIYPAVLTVLGVVGSLVMFVYAIRTANHHVPHHPSVNMMYEQREDSPE